MSIELISKAGSSDQPELHQLWETVFCDPPEIVESFFERFPPEITGWVLRRGDKICSAGYLIPGNWYIYGAELCPVAYVYAVATAPAERAKGYAGKLMQSMAAYARERGLILYTRPAENSLFPWYSKTMGADHIGYFQEALHADSSEICNSKIRRLTPDEYGSMREKLLADQPHICMSENYLRLQESYSDGFYAVGDSCCCVVKENDILHLTELLARETEKSHIVQALLSHFDLKKAMIRTVGERSDKPGVAYTGSSLPLNTNWGLLLE